MAGWKTSASEMLEAQRPAYFPWLPVLFGLGIGAYFTLSIEPWPVIAAGLCVVSLFGVKVLDATHRMARIVMLGLLTISLGFGAAVLRGHLVAAPILEYRYYGPVEGRVVEISRSQGNALRVTLDQVRLGTKAAHETPARVRISLLGGAPHARVAPGAVLMVTANLSPPSGPAEPDGFDFRRHAWFKKLGAIGYAHASPLPATLETRARSDAGLWLFDTRMSIADAIRRVIPGATGAFAAAILTGDRSEIDPAMLKDLRASNLAHLLAISGLHMGLLTGFVLVLVRYGLLLVPPIRQRYPIKKIAAACALLAGAAYLGLSGANVATQRAFIMAAVIYGAILFDRQALTLRSVALAAMIVLILRPESLTEAGFQMSFAATTGLVAGFQFLRTTHFWSRLKTGRGRYAQPIVMLVISSGLAGLATAPFSAFHFNQVAQYGLIANLAAVPMMGMVVMPASVAAALLWPIGLSWLPLWLMGVGIDWILGVAHFVASLDGAVTRIPSGSAMVLPILSLACLFGILWNGKARLAAIPCVALSLFLWAQTERPDVLISADGRLIGVKTAEGRAISHQKGNGFAVRSWLENDGDRATQDQAHARSGFSYDNGTLDIELDGTRLQQVRSKKIDPSGLCHDQNLIIATETWEKPAGDCQFFGREALRKTGAIAIYASDAGLKIISANQRAGRRLWSQ